MHMQCVGAQIAEGEAREIGGRIQNEILSDVPHGGRIKLDLSVTMEPDDGTMHHGDDAGENYGATRDWLKKFSRFCFTCKGLEVL